MLKRHGQNKWCLVERLLATVALTLLLALAVSAPAEAARRKVVFQLSNMLQWIDLSYTYKAGDNRADDRPDNSFQNHLFEESYHFEIDYALLDYRLVNGRLELEIKADHEVDYKTGSRGKYGDGFGVLYDFDATFFERRPLTFSLDSYRQQQYVNEPFVDSYTETQSSYGGTLHLKQDQVPIRFIYRVTESETSGLTIDRTYTIKDLRITANHRWDDFSDTVLEARLNERDIGFDDPDRAAIKKDAYELIGENTLNWGDLVRQNTLTSSYSFLRESGQSSTRSMYWKENLRLQLGNALSAGGSYGLNQSENQFQKRENQTRGAWIEHRLYKSLWNRFSYSLSDTQYATGEEKNFSRVYNVSYSKRLPRESQLNLGYGFGYGETDRNLSDQQLFGSENISVDVSRTAILDQINIDSGTIRVFSEDRLIEYFNFSVRQLANLQTELTINEPGAAFVVEYSYLVNRSVEFSTTSQNVSASLSLFNSRFFIYFTASQSDQDLIDGVPDLNPLIEQKFFQTGIDVNEGKLTYGASFLFLDSTLSKEETFEAYLNYLRDYRNGLISVRLTERYSEIEGNEGVFFDAGATLNKNSRNTLLLLANYQRNFGRKTSYELYTELADSRSEVETRNDLVLGGSIEHRWYKFVAQVRTEINFILIDDSLSREDNVFFNLRRYF